MQTLVDDALRDEAVWYRLRFGCQDCAHFNPEKQSCAEGFPNAPHLDVRFEKGTLIEFCKSFELA
jgi:hypothetical protein